MAGLVIPLGLDTKNFEDAFKKAERQIGGMMRHLDLYASKSVKASDVLSSGFERANIKANEFVGTTERISHAMKAIENITNSINLKTEGGQKKLAENYNEWVKLRTVMGDANVSFEKLYKMQQEYQALIGRDYKINTLADAQNLPKLIEQEKELIKLIQDEEKQRLKVIAEKEKADAEYHSKRIEQERRVQEEISKIERARKRADVKAAFDDLTQKEQIAAAAVADPALSMKARTIDEYKKKIIELQAAQRQLDMTNDSGKRKFKELSDEIKKSEKAVSDLERRKKDLRRTSDDLTKKFATLFSLQQIGNFTRNVITIGGELEKQRIALGSIVKDISKANMLFSQLKTQALQSPFTFKKIIDGTRQLAAYNIEVEKLYDTQKMLSDLSAGLGVDVARLILAYGQVRAAAVLRGQELRQFTEAGIPIIDALAAKFTELEGRVVSSSEVFDKVSSRLVPFKMVHEVLQEMTQEGGKFFQMQEKMANTIAGQWVNVRDSIDQMYMDIANQQEGFIMSVIKGMRRLIENWRLFQYGATAAATAYVAYLGFSAVYHSKNLKFLGTANTLLATKIGLIKMAKAAMLGFVGVAVVGLVMLIGQWINASKEMERYGKTMSEITSRHSRDMSSESENLKTLINQMEKATVGTEEYRKIKDKIRTQYGDYLPLLIDENTTVQQIASSYDYATSAMKAHYAEKALQEQMAKMKEDRGIKKRRDSLEGGLQTQLRYQGISDADAERITFQYMRRVDEMIAAGEKINDAFQLLKNVGRNYGIEIQNSARYNKVLRSTMSEAFSTYISNLLGDYSRDVSQKTQAAINTNKAQFDDLAISVKKGINAVEDAFNEEMKRISSDTEFFPLDNALLKGDAERRKALALVVAQSLDAMNSEMIRQGKTITKQIQDQYIEIIRGAFEVGDVDKQSILNYIGAENAELVDRIFETLSRKLEESPRVKTTSIQRDMEFFFKSINQGLREERASLSENDDAQKKNISLREAAAANVRDLTYNILSLNDAQELLTTKEGMTESLRQNQNAIIAYRAELAKLEEGTDAYREKLHLINITLSDIQFLELRIEYIDQLIKRYNILSKETKRTGGENPEVERARRLVQIYKELNQSYEKYAQYKDDEYSTQQSMAEMLDDYNKLRRELGNRIPELTAIKSQKELVKALEDVFNSRAFTTKKGRSVLQRYLIGERGGQLVEEAKKSFEELKKDSERILGSIVVGFNTDEVISQIDDIIKELKAMGGEQALELAIDLKIRTDKEAVKSALKQIDNELQIAKDKYSLGREFKSMQEQFMFTMPDMFKDSVISYEDYIGKLYEVRDRYLSQGDEGVQKANELSMFISKEQFDYIRNLYQEAFKMQFDLMDSSEKIESIQKRSNQLLFTKEKLELQKELIEKQKESIGLSDDENSPYQALLANIAYLEALIETLNRQKETLMLDAFRISEMYQGIYGDIAKWGTDSYNAILNAMRESMLAAKELADGSRVIKDPFTGKDIVISAREFGKALGDIEKKLRDISEKNPFKKISNEFKKSRQEISMIVNGEEVTRMITNFESLGDAISLIGEQLKKVGELFESLGVSDSAVSYIDGASSVLGGIGGIIASKGTDLSAWVQLVKGTIQLLDVDNNKRIKKIGEEIEKLERVYDKLLKELPMTVGITEYNNKLKESIQILEDIEKKNLQMAKEAEDKKGKNQEEIDGYYKKAEDAAQKRLDAVQDHISKWSVTIEDAAKSFADSWIDAFIDVGDGMGAFEKSFESMMKKIASQQIQQAFMSVALKPLIDQLQRSILVDSDGGIMITDKEISAIMAAKSTSKAMIEAYSGTINDLLRSLGLGDGAYQYDTLQKGIQGITENTAQIIASYMNSVRLEVINIRMLMQKNTSAGTDPISQINQIMILYYPQYLDNLIAIRENTSYLKESYNPSIRGFRIG